MSLAPAHAADRRRILIVEDDYLTAEAVGDLVRDCGLEVAGTVGQVERGIEFLSRQEVDGAVVDINLHGRPSYPLCHELQQRNTPFVFLTGYGRSMVPPEFRQARLLSKPVDPREFKAALTAFAESARPTPAAGDRGNRILDALAGADWQDLRARLEQVPLEVGQILEAPWEKITHVHFPISGLV
jgi:DNA-binding response OmpR family regulator